MQNTTNLKLKKPNLTDAINIDDFNYNADIIDAEIKKLLDSVGSLASLNTAQKTNLVGAINEVLGKFNSIKLEAENVTIKDLENLFTATKVEGALSEVMKKANTNATNISTLQRNDGDLRTLKTTDKSSLVGAVNELFQNANNGKTTIANAIGTPLTPSDTFATMGTKIDTLTDTFKNNLVAKGIEVLPNDKMSNLIDKVGVIPLGKKWVSGSSMSASGTLKFYGVNSGYSASNTYIDITGLDFLPSIIIITRPTSRYYFSTVLNSSMTQFSVPVLHRSGGFNETISSTSYSYTFDISKSPAIFTVGDIRIPINDTGTSNYNIEYTWIAFE